LLNEERVYSAFEVRGKLYQYKRLLLGIANGVSTFQRLIAILYKKINMKLCSLNYLDDLTVTKEIIEAHNLNLISFLDNTAYCNLNVYEGKSNNSCWPIFVQDV